MPKISTDVITSEAPLPECPDLVVEINRRARLTWLRFEHYSTGLYDRLEANPELKVRLLKVEVLETLQYGCGTWSLRKGYYNKLRTLHH